MSRDGRRHEEQVRIFLRPIGSGLPLGFFSFGIGMLLLGCSAIGWIPLTEQKEVGRALIAFVFPLELLAAVVAFLAVAGGIAIALAALAMYGGTALGLEDARGRELLPLFRRGNADEAFQGFEAQLDRLEAEPGVRQQL